jgi:hypothetical protein
MNNEEGKSQGARAAFFGVRGHDRALRLDDMSSSSKAAIPPERDRTPKSVAPAPAIWLK